MECMHRKQEQGKEQMDKYFAVKNVYAKASMILKMIKTLKNYLKENKINWSDLYDQKSQKAQSEFQKVLVIDIKNEINLLKDSDVKTTALGI